MKKIDMISISCFAVLMVLNYLACFMDYADIDFLDGSFRVVLLLMSYPAVLYIAVWYLIFLVKNKNSIIVKILVLLFLVALPLVFVMPATNPIYQGMLHLNKKLGGNEVLVDWADKIFDMPLCEVAENYNSQDAVLKIRESLIQEVFSDVFVSATILEYDGRKVIKVRYPGNGGVLFGDVDLIKKHYRFALYEVDGFFLWWLPK